MGTHCTETTFAQVALDRVGKCVLFGREMRVNWAFQKELQEEVAGHIHIFVGDLSLADVTDAILLSAFQHCPGCSDARVMWDHATRRSRGYGFVSFRQMPEAEEAIKSMHGQFVGARRVRCGWAQHKTDFAAPMDPSMLDRSDPTNTNVYVGNLSPQLTGTSCHLLCVSVWCTPKQDEVTVWCVVVLLIECSLCCRC